jgi:hypothetical protein
MCILYLDNNIHRYRLVRSHWTFDNNSVSIGRYAARAGHLCQTHRLGHQTGIFVQLIIYNLMLPNGRNNGRITKKNTNKIILAKKFASESLLQL